MFKPKVLDQITFIFEDSVPPKKNSRDARVGRRKDGSTYGYTVPSKAYKEWHADMLVQFQFITHFLPPPNALHVAFYPADFTLADMDNAVTSIQDWLQDAKVFSADHMFGLPDTTHTLAGIDKKYPRVVATAFSVEPDPFMTAVALLRDKKLLRDQVNRLKKEGHKTSQVKYKNTLLAAMGDRETFDPDILTLSHLST